MFAALAEGFGDLENKVNIYVAMAPVLYIAKTQDNFLKDLSGMIPEVKEGLDSVKLYEFFGPTW